MSISYLIYQAERPRSAAELRAADRSRGELARALSSLLRGRRQAGPIAPAAPAAPVSPAASAAPAAPAAQVCAAVKVATADRPAFTLIKGTTTAAADSGVRGACVPAQRDNRAAC